MTHTRDWKEISPDSRNASCENLLVRGELIANLPVGPVGPGTVNTLAKFTGTGTTVGNSGITDNGADIAILAAGADGDVTVDGAGTGSVITRSTSAGGNVSQLEVANSFATVKHTAVAGNGSQGDFRANACFMWVPPVALNSGPLVQLNRFTVAGGGSIIFIGDQDGITEFSNVRIGKAGDRIGFFGSNGVVLPAAQADAAGGVVIDVEARTAINGLLAKLRALKLIAT